MKQDAQNAKDVVYENAKYQELNMRTLIHVTEQQTRENVEQLNQLMSRASTMARTMSLWVPPELRGRLLAAMHPDVAARR